MNRSILIVICDFLLVSLLAFSTADINKAADQGTPQLSQGSNATNRVDTGQDLAAVMRMALNEERKGRERLMGELDKTRETLGERERQAQLSQQEAQSLQGEKARLERQYASAQASLGDLDRQLKSNAAEALLTREKLAAMEAETRKETNASEGLRQRLAQLASSNELALAEQQRLASRLQLAEVERRDALGQAARMAEEVKAEREQEAKLAEGFKVLATNSVELTHEIRDNQPLAPNAIFNSFVANRVAASFDALKPGFFSGESSKRKETKTVLVTDGTNTFALCHVQDTPFTFWTPGIEWDGISGALSHNSGSVPIQSLSFGWPDPRVVLIPVTPQEARQLNCKIYRISTDPYKFQDAVLVGADEGYYGECRFQIDLSEPGYVKLDNNFLKGLFGKFNPSRGDLVFSKHNELLGVMVNGTYCMRIPRFESQAAIHFGRDIRSQRPGEMLSQLHATVMRMPFKLQ